MADAVNYLGEEVGAGVEASAVTVGRILARNGLTGKVMERFFSTRNGEERALWVEAQLRVPLRCHVYLDEAHRVGRAAECRRVRCLRGARAECYVEASPGVRMSSFVAMAQDQVLGWMLTRPPSGQKAGNFLALLKIFLIPRMRSVEEELA